MMPIVLDNRKNNNDMPNLENRRNKCPGFFRMPQANDGGICRIKLPLGILKLEQIDALTEAANRFSNGQIELTTRANIQLRAIKTADEGDLIKYLLSKNLGPLNEKSDDIRNVLIPATAGIDSFMTRDTRILGHDLLTRLQTNPKYFSLSPKFSILINGGESTAIYDHSADIWLSSTNKGENFNFGFASLANQPLGCIKSNHATSFIEAILLHFIEIQQQNENISRMKHLKEHYGFDNFIPIIQKTIPFQILPAHKGFEHSQEQKLIGIFKQNDSKHFYVGARPKLGRLTSKELYEIKNIANLRKASSPLRLTHHQSIIFDNSSYKEAVDIQNALAKLGLGVKKSETASTVFCCSGAPYCKSAKSNTQRDGHTLLKDFQGFITKPLHLTACEKSCVATTPFDYTALAISDGVYNLYKADNCAKNKFGSLLAENMPIAEIALYLNKQNKKA